MVLALNQKPYPLCCSKKNPLPKVVFSQNACGCVQVLAELIDAGMNTIRSLPRGVIWMKNTSQAIQTTVSTTGDGRTALVNFMTLPFTFNLDKTSRHYTPIFYSCGLLLCYATCRILQVPFDNPSVTGSGAEMKPYRLHRLIYIDLQQSSRWTI